MERLDSPEAKGIFAFFSRTSPKSAEDEEKDRKERDKAFAEKVLCIYAQKWKGGGPKLGGPPLPPGAGQCEVL